MQPQTVISQRRRRSLRMENALSFSSSKLILIIFFSITLSLLGSTIQPATTAASDLQKKIEEHKVKIQRLQRGIRKQQSESAQTRSQEKHLLDELASLEMRLIKQKGRVDELESRVAEQQQLITAKEEEISHLQKEKSLVLEHLKKRTSAYYKMGKIGFLNVTFSTRSLPELLKFHDAFQTLIAYDQKVVSEFRQKIFDLERARDAYSLEKELLQEFMVDAHRQGDEIDNIKAQKQELLGHIRTQKHLHQQAIEELEQATRELSSQLIALKNQEEDLKQTFARSKGDLPPPISGKVITYFNQEKENKLGILRKSAGIAIKADAGSRVRAIADGTVVFSGYLRGYGNTVIIHHGYQYYSVTSRLEKIRYSQGQKVRAGNSIGILSDTATLIDEGLYFEIRRGKDSQDPLQWLNTSKLDLEKDSPTQTQEG